MIIKGAAFSDGTETCPRFPPRRNRIIVPGHERKRTFVFYFLGKSEEDRTGTRKKGSAFEQKKIKLDIVFSLLREIKAGVVF